MIAQVNIPEEKVEKYEFAPGDVFGLDIIMSTGEGKARESEIRTTVFKRVIENQYQLKSDSARKFLSEVNKKFPSLPFSIRYFSDNPTQAKLGVKHCLDHELLEPFYVVEEREGEYTACVKATVALLPSGLRVLSGNVPLPSGKYESEFSITDEEVKKTLAISLDNKKTKEKKEKKEKK